MTLTAKEALGHVRHALSSDKMPTVGGLRILNDAGESLVNMHSWRWLEGAQAYLSLRSGVDHVWLPENFRELMSLVASNSLNSGISLTTPDQIARHRADSSGSALHYMAAVVFAPKEVAAYADVEVAVNSVTADSTFTIEGDSNPVVFQLVDISTPAQVSTSLLRYVIRDTSSRAVTADRLLNAINEAPDLNVRALKTSSSGPSSFRVEAKISGEYVTGTFGVAASVPAQIKLNGTTVSPQAALNVSGPGGAPRPRLDLWPTPGADSINGLTAYFRAGWRSIRGDRDTISVPAFMEPLYIQMVRTFALGYERDSEADISRRLGGLRGSTMFKDCRTRDSLLHPTYGPAINGAAAGELTGSSAMWNFGSIGGPS